MKRYFPLFLFLCLLSCASERFRIEYLGRKKFHPRYPGQTVLFRVYDKEEERYVLIRSLEFLFSPPHWGKVLLTKEEKIGKLEVQRIYTHPLYKIHYRISIRLKQGEEP